MNKPYHLLVFLILLTLQACASHLPGEKAAVVSGQFKKQGDKAPPLEVSVEELSTLSSRGYRGFLVSYQNNTDDWIRVERTGLELYNIKNPQLLLGSDLETYLKSVNRRNRIQNHNRSLMMAAVAITAGVMARSQDAATRRAGGLALSGTIGYEAIRRTLKGKNSAELVEALPEGHLLRPMSIPPGLSNTSWFVVKMPEDLDYKAINISVTETNQRKSEFAVASPDYASELNRVYEVKLRKQRSRYKNSDFQAFKNDAVMNLFKKASH